MPPLCRLVDLFGIVDPRLAAVEPMYEMPGHPFHRRPAGEMTVANQPDVAYLYDGADCSGVSSDLASEKVAWNDLLNAGVTRCRIGDPVEVLSNYIPVSLVVDGEINGRVLVRRAFLDDEWWKGDVQRDLCRRL